MALRKDRRDSQDEERQKARLAEILKDVTSDLNLNLNLDYWDKVGKGNSRDSIVLTESGKFVKPNEMDYKPVEGRDSKRLDGLAIVSNGIKNLNLFFFCKYTKQNGGMQKNIKYEVTKTTDNMSKYDGNDSLLFFLLEGDLWDNDETFKHDKGFVNNSILLPTNGDDKAIALKIKENILKSYYSN